MSKRLPFWPQKPPWWAFWRQREYHQKRFFIRIIIFGLSLTGLSVSLVLIARNAELRRKASEDPHIPMLVEFVFDPVSQQVTINRADPVQSIEINNTTFNHHKKTAFITDPKQNRQEVDVYWIETAGTEDHSQLLMESLEPAELTSYTLSKPVAIVRFDYMPGSHISIEPPQLNQPQRVETHQLETIANKVKADDRKILQQTNKGSKNKLDIAYVPNGFSNYNEFISTAKSMHQFLLTIKPFNHFTQDLIPHYINNQLDLGCFRPESIPRLIVCDYYLVQRAVGNIPADQIIVIDNSYFYGGSAINGLAITYADINGLAKEVMVHEFGHSFGGLNDEYYLGPYYWQDPPWANCAGESTCAKWTGIPGASCVPECGFSNLFRPTENQSLMRTLFPDGGFQFGPVSEEHLTTLLAQYTGIIPTDLDGDNDTDGIDFHLLLQRPFILETVNNFIKSLKIAL